MSKQTKLGQAARPTPPAGSRSPSLVVLLLTLANRRQEERESVGGGVQHADAARSISDRPDRSIRASMHCIQVWIRSARRRRPRFIKDIVLPNKRPIKGGRGAPSRCGVCAPATYIRSRLQTKTQTTQQPTESNLISSAESILNATKHVQASQGHGIVRSRLHRPEGVRTVESGLHSIRRCTQQESAS